MYYCFGCHAGGSAITFLMERERIEFSEAVEILAQQAHMELPQMLETDRERVSRGEKERLYEANKECARFYHAQLWNSDNKHMLAYLHERGVSDGVIRKFGLGSTPVAADGATSFLREMGFTMDELVSAGITVKRDKKAYDMFRARVIFPIIDAHGRVLGFGGRALGDAKPKYLNTGDTPVFNKRRSVYAANLLAKQRNMRRIILTEGYMDVIALVQARVDGVCATLGTALTLEQARLLKRWAPEVWIAYDGDSAGQHAILRALEIFEDENMPARVLDFPDGMDPDEFVRKNEAGAIERLIPVNGTVYRMMREAENHDLTTQEGRTEYAKACAKWLSRIREPVELENYVQRLMVETGFAREVLLAQIGRTEMIEEDKRSDYQRKPYAAERGGTRDEDLFTASAERQLLQLLASGIVTGDAVHASDFITPEGRALAEKLISGLKPGAILEEIEDEDERSRAAVILQEDAVFPEGEDLQMVQDCLDRLHQRKIDSEIETLRQELTSGSSEEKRAILLRIQDLTKERRQMGNRKEG